MIVQLLNWQLLKCDSVISDFLIIKGNTHRLEIDSSNLKNTRRSLELNDLDTSEVRISSTLKTPSLKISLLSCHDTFRTKIIFP